MKTPFWWYADSPVAPLLAPLAGAYNCLRRKPGGERVELPVSSICIGNVVAGGAGKTPVALAIGAWAKQHGMNAYYVSRGYKGSLAGPLLVDAARHDAGLVGDEPLLLAAQLPTVVAKSRLAGARYAVAQGAELIIFDDGLQYYALKPTLSILVVKGSKPFGNGRLLPAGPLREPVVDALSRVQAIVHLDPPDVPVALPELSESTIPVYTAHTQLQMPPMHSHRVIGFAGIARPELFEQSLKQSGLDVLAFHSYGDHKAYSSQQVQRLAEEAGCHHATLVTTQKDYARLPTPELKACVVPIPQQLVWEDSQSLDKLLGTYLKRNASKNFAASA